MADALKNRDAGRRRRRIRFTQLITIVEWGCVRVATPFNAPHCRYRAFSEQIAIATNVPTVHLRGKPAGGAVMAG